ncbi:VWA domain-containing protein [Schlesneria paludicola]|uniref:VWA domain-containing protein n=1 Tax=Schlesneria paludicola TaxID=360056 RepID=UPI00029AE015|nr:VWA domain-containing protein [Schlesneria paludicola]
MLSVVNRISRKRRNAVFSPWLIASLFVHALIIPVLLLMNSGTPYGTHVFGSSGDEGLSLTWIPGNSSGRQGSIDTVIPGDEDLGAIEPAMATTSSASTVQSTTKLVVENEPQTVFNGQEETSLPLLVDGSGTRRPEQSSADSPQEANQELESSDQDNHGSATSPPPAAHVRGKGSGKGEDVDGEGVVGGNDSPGSGGNRVEFFGIQARGKRVVYLIDASDSMRQHRAIDLAREELWRSLSELKSTSQFQIVFFDLKCHTFSIAGNQNRLVTATSPHLRLAKQFMVGIRPDSGTDRLLAITHALGFDPEILFVLTDVDAPELNAQDLSKIRRSNKRQAEIHAVEFGLGPDLSRDSFLKKLARQNRGTHRYVDLKSPRP